LHTWTGQRQDPPEEEYLTFSKAVDLISWVRTYDYIYTFERPRAVAIMATFLFTGLRHSELLNVKWRDFDFETNKLLVRAENAKHEKPRVVDFPDTLKDYLREYIEEFKKRGKTTEYFFATLRIDGRMGAGVIRRLVKKIRERSGIYFYPHMLRHTFASMLFAQGVDILTIRDLLGHTSIQQTLRYCHIDESHIRSQVLKHPMARPNPQY